MNKQEEKYYKLGLETARKETIKEIEKIINKRLEEIGTDWEMYNTIEVLNSIKNELKEKKP